ncbi:MAG TPA: fatty acid desaturase, partial [Burkholderiales bacterium]|nr:fatty acid desaturase [Burkholderiales bacterium]
GSATATIAWLVHVPGIALNALVLCVVLFVVNVLYDIKALRAGILRVYNQPWADGRDARAIAIDYAPWFFGGFGLVYGAGIGVMERYPSMWVFAGTLLVSMVLPVAGYAVQSKWRWGHWGVIPSVVEGPEPQSIVPPDHPGPSTSLGMTSRREALNWLILLASIVATSACLWLASHGVLIAAVAFMFINNVPFALMHEAVHGAASKPIGFIASCMFPTSFSLQRVAHNGHHARNRTDDDLYDYYLPKQSRFVRNVWLYAGNLLGLYWFCIPISNALYLLGTPFYRSRFFVERVAPAIGFGPHVRDIVQLPPLRVWVEILCAFAYQAGLWWLLDLEWRGWLLSHWLFAMHWSALQYVDHAWSARDVTHGAWNLRVFAPVRWLALNYHYHHAHHSNPAAPWTELPALARAQS